MREKVLRCRYALWNAFIRHSEAHKQKYGHGLILCAFLLVTYQIIHLVVSLNDTQFETDIEPVTPHNKVLYQFEHEKYKFNWENRNKLRKFYKTQAKETKNNNDKENSQSHPHSQHTHSLTNPNDINDYFYQYFPHLQPISLSSIFKHGSKIASDIASMQTVKNSTLLRQSELSKITLEFVPNIDMSAMQTSCEKMNIFWTNGSYIDVPWNPVTYFELKHTIATYLFANDALSGFIVRLMIEQLTNYRTGILNPTIHDTMIVDLQFDLLKELKQTNEHHSSSHVFKKATKKSILHTKGRKKSAMMQSVYYSDQKCDLSVICMKTEAYLYKLTSNYLLNGEIHKTTNANSRMTCTLFDQIKKYNIETEAIASRLDQSKGIISKQSEKHGINAIFLLRDPWISFWLLFQFDHSLHESISSSNRNQKQKVSQATNDAIYCKYGCFAMSRRDWIDNEWDEKFKSYLLGSDKVISNWLEQFAMIEKFANSKLDHVVVKYDNLFDVESYEMRMREIEKLLQHLVTNDYYGTYQKDFWQRMSCMFFQNNKIMEEFRYQQWMSHVIKNNVQNDNIAAKYVTINDAYSIFTKEDICDVWNKIRDKAKQYGYKCWKDVSCG